MRDSSVRRWSTVHRAIYRWSGGRLGSRLVGNDMLLLTTRGRRTGKAHTVPLLWLHDGETIAVIASYGGRDYHPAWYLNLVDAPEVSVQTADGSMRLIARTAAPAEREMWWPRIVEAYSDYATYQGRTTREIPVVLLEPAS
jgi:deazaflavin-dependent oxidoreductase (nitroreductase family)